MERSSASATAGGEDAVAASARFRVKGSSSRGLAMATLAFFGGFAGVSVFGPLVPRFAELMRLSPVEAGLLVAIPNLTGSLLRIPFGAMVDRYGGKRPMLVLLCLPLFGLSGLIALTALYYPGNMEAGLYPLLLLLGAIIGSGIATFSVGIAQVSYWFPQKKQGSALGIFGGLGNTAPGIFALLLPVVLSAFGMTSAYLFWLAFLIAVTLVYARWAVDAPWFQLRRQLGHEPSPDLARAYDQELTPSGSGWRALRVAGTDIRTWALVALYFTSFGGFLALTGWFPTYWRLYHDVGLVQAGFLTLVYAELASLTRVGSGFITDRLGGEVVLIGSLATLCLGALAIAFGGLFAVSLLGMALMGVSMGAANAAVFKLVPKYANRSVGGAAGWIGGIGAFGGFAIPPIMGAVVALLGHAGYALSFLVFVGLGAVSIGIALGLRRGPWASSRFTGLP